MNAWRMAFRAGNRGQSLWKECRELSVAAITYSPLEKTDLSEEQPGDPKALWAKLEPTQKASLRRVAYDMKAGDKIYVKEGPQIVAKGIVIGPYEFDSQHRIVDASGFPWPHQVPVDWSSDFPTVDVLLGGEQVAVKPLSPAEVERIESLAYSGGPLREGDTTPAVRILPMDSDEDEFKGQSMEDVQDTYFLNNLPIKNNGRYLFHNAGLRAKANTIVLFQFKNRIVACAILRRVERFELPEDEKFTGALHFDPKSIRVFNPIGADVVRRIWADFRKFNNVKQHLDPKRFPEFEREMKQIRIPQVSDPATDLNELSDMQSGAGFGTAAGNKRVEEAAIAAVRQRYTSDGWIVSNQMPPGCGFDLECSKNGAIENVEVKGTRGIARNFFITANEVEAARRNHNFVLIVVTSALSESPVLKRYSGSEFCRDFDLSTVLHRAVLRR